jgi:tetratricopeptide (TPR) repeat protein
MKSTLAVCGSGGICATLISLMLAANCFAACTLQKYAELPVVMNGRRAVVEGSINGSPATFIADSGAFYSMLWPDLASRLHLRLEKPPGGMELRGIGGKEDPHVTTVNDFALRGLGVGVLHKVQFLVAGQSTGPEDGLIGQNIIGRADTEYDLGNGAIRLFHSIGCEKNSLAYWAGTSAVSEMTMEQTSDWEPHIIGSAKLNGLKINVVFDTGSPVSEVSLKAANRAGFNPASATGNFRQRSPLGPRESEIWVTRFDDLDLGGEEIKNVKMRVSDSVMPGNFDLILGTDFFLSHRIFVAQSQHKIYFTYMGGRVFEFPEENSGAASSVTTPAPENELPGDSPQDAALYMRRGAASAARGDLQQAIANFNAAIRLNPNDAESYYRRGKAKMQTHQYPEARADFDQALKLQPDNATWLNTRGVLRVLTKDDQGAAVDFDAAGRLTPDTENLDLGIAAFLEDFGQLEAAIIRVGRWIEAHPNNAEMPSALNSRCWYRAQLGKELEKALEDCDESLKLKSNIPETLDSRGLVYLRMGNYDKSIADYEAALRQDSKQAASLYGLGLAQLHKGQQEEASKNMRQALAINSETAERFRKFGVSP